MGEKPTEQDDAEARSMDKASPELMDAREAGSGQAAGIAVSDPGMPPERPSTNREAGSGAATSLLGHEAAHTQQQQQQSGRQASGGGAGIAIDEEGVQRIAAGDVDADSPPDERRAGLQGAQTNPMYEKKAEDTGGGPRQEQATNLNSSKSNVYRTGDPGPSDGGGDAGIAVNDDGGPQGRGNTRPGS